MTLPLKDFFVDVLASERENFHLSCRFNKKLRVVTLGDAVNMSLDDARQAARTWLHQIKSGKIRHIPLSVGARRPIFANPKTGLPFVSFFYSWDAARKRAGLPDLRVHDLRHSFASFLVNAGRSLYEVQELLGHADIRTTSRYAHLSRERLFAAVESVPVL